jgi:hypothetical protein
MCALNNSEPQALQAYSFWPGNNCTMDLLPHEQVISIFVSMVHFQFNGALTSDGLTVASLLAAGKPLMVQRMVDRREAADSHTWTKATIRVSLSERSER